MMKKLMNVSIVMLSLFAFMACSDDDNIENGNDSARMSIKLVDDPGDYESVFVEVEDVVIKYNGDETETSIDDVNAGIYDLLELTGGASVLLADDEVPTGDISQIRLVLGDENTVVVNGETHPLQTPSAQQSGLKVQVNETLEAGVLYEFILDFDVEESIVVQGNGGYLLKPVIRASAEAETGAISGLVLPIGTQTLVTAENETTGEEISTYTDANGIFMLNGVPEGTYTLTFEADSELGFEPIVISGVEVEVGSTTEVEDVTFQ